MNIYTLKLLRISLPTLTFWLLCILAGYSQTITGTVFRDFNANGVYEAIPTSGTYSYGEPGVVGVIVKATGTGGPQSVTTGANGSYTISGMSGAVRLEFTGLQTGDFDGAVATSGSSVQFVQAGSTANFGVNYPRQYCNSLNPDLVTSCYLFGDQVNGTAQNSPVLVSFPYRSGSRSIVVNPSLPTSQTNTNGIYDQPTSHTLVTTEGRLAGTTFGLAYARLTKKLFAASFFKKHSGFGPGADGNVNTADDPAAIYVINTTNNSVTNVFSLPGITTNAHNVNDYIRDNDDIAWDAVGKTSIGGMDLSDDEQTLYVMNLENRNLYALNPQSGALKTNRSVPLTLPGCPTASDVRPFAVEYYRGQVYVGIICSAESSNSPNDLKAYIYTADPATLSFGSAPVFQFNLNYPRGKAAGTGPADWQPWRPQYTNISNNLGARVVYPMPMLTGITFDNDNLIIGLRDRLGDIVGNQSKDNPANENLYQARTAGDLLRAAGSPSTGWTLENAGRSNGNGTSIQNTNQGPGGAEFYQGDAYPLAASVSGTSGPTSATAGNRTFSWTIATGTSTVSNGAIGNIQGFGQNHDEVILGASMQLGGSPEVAAVVFDPVPDNGGEGFFDGGIRWLDNTTGSWMQSYRLYNGDGSATRDFGKANGLGELVGACAPAPIMIGNRVWNDLNNNGLQDPNEPPLAGVVVQLKGPGVPSNTTAVTNGNGEYYFTNATGTSANGFVYSLTGLTSGGSYSLCFPTSATALSLSQKPNQDPNGRIDAKPNSTGIVSFTLGNAGQNNFTYDAAYVACALAVSTTATCQSATNQYVLTGSVSLTGNANASTLTITANGASTTVAAPANQSTVSYTLANASLVSNGPRTATLTVTSSATACGTTSVTYTVPAACTVCSLSITTTALASGTVGQPYSQSIATSGAAPGSLSFATTGTLPAGLSLNAATGVISGTPTAAGTTNFSLTVTDTKNCSAAVPLTVTLVCPPLTLLPTTLPNAQVGTAYSQTLSANGGTTPYSYSVTAGSLPAGLSLTNGVISGAPSASGLSSFTVTATDANNCAVNLPLSISVASAPVCSLVVSATAGACDPATNRYTATYSLTLTNPPSTTGVVTVTDGAESRTVTVPANTTSASGQIAGLLSDGLIHTLSASLSGCGTASTTYAAPVSCSVAPPCSISATAQAGACNPVTNQYSATVVVTVTNPVTGNVSVTTGGITQVLSATGGFSQNTLTYTFDGLPSTGGTPTVSLLSSGTACGSLSITYAAPSSCSVAAPVVAVVVGTPTCNTATNTYTASGTVTITNATAGATLTVTDNGSGVLSQTVTAGASSVPFSVTGVSNGPANRTVVATLTNGTSVSNSTTYTVPQACTVCSLSITTTALASGTVGQPYSQTIATTGGTGSLTFAATGTLPAGLSLNPSTGVVSGTPTAAGTGNVTVTVTDSKNCADDQPLSISIAPAPPTVQVSVGTPVCNSATNTYTASGTVTLTNAPASATLTVTDNGNIVLSQTVTAGQPTATFSVSGVSNGPANRTVVATLTNGTSVSSSTAYTVPQSCTTAPNTMLDLVKVVSQSKAKVGDVLTYTLVLSNTGQASTSALVSDLLSEGATYVTGSASAPLGTTFTPALSASAASTWTIPSITAGQSLSLTFQVTVTTEGIVYNTASIPGKEVQVCTSIPVKVCPGDEYTYRLTAPSGRSRYQWFRVVTDPVSGTATTTELTSFTTNVIEVSQPGEYRLSVDNAEGLCPAFACCPFIIEEVAPVGSFSLTAVAATCSQTTVQTNGSITLTGLTSTTAAPLTYALVRGTTFETGTPVTSGKTALPANGLLSSTLTTGTYWVRVYNAAGCFSEQSVVIPPTDCSCPPAKCVPFVLKKTKSASGLNGR